MNQDYAHPNSVLYTTAISRMGLISKTVVLFRNYAHPGICLEITPPLIRTLSLSEACQRQYSSKEKYRIAGNFRGVKNSVQLEKRWFS